MGRAVGAAARLELHLHLVLDSPGLDGDDGLHGDDIGHVSLAGDGLGLSGERHRSARVGGGGGLHHSHRVIEADSEDLTTVHRDP